MHDSPRLQRVFNPQLFLSLFHRTVTLLPMGSIASRFSTTAVSYLDVIPEEEIIRLKEQNTLSPLCRMPDEIIVHIVQALQVLQKPKHRFQRRGYSRISSFHEWTKVMLVCTRLRDVLVHTPELWAFYHSQWPKSLQDLYLSRARNRPLNTYLALCDTAEATAAIPLFRRSAVVFLHFDNNDGQNGVEHYSIILNLDAPNLRLLCADGRRCKPELALLSSHMARFAHLSELTLSRTYVGSHCLFPQSLRILYLHRADIPLHVGRLGDLFRHLYLLEHLEFRKISHYHDLLDPAPIEFTPIPLPQLRCLIIDDCSLEFVSAVAQVITPPQCFLKLVVNVTSVGWWRHSEFPDVHAMQQSMKANVFAFVQHFWRCITGKRNLPQDAALHLPLHKGLSSRYPPKLVLRAKQSDHDSPRLQLTMKHDSCYAIPADDPFLVLVIEVRVSAAKDTMGVVLDSDLCPVFTWLPAIQVLRLSIPSASEVIARTQAWADAHAPQLAVVGIRTNLGAHGPELIWKPEDGLLKDLDWSGYNAEEKRLLSYYRALSSRPREQ
jgi:hypothetical protein